jgi:CBS domain containing-hemolysin-like protein
VRAAVEKLDDAIAATQVGITFASLALGWIGEPALAHMIHPLFQNCRPCGGVAEHALAGACAYLLLTYLHVVLGEQAPKALAIQRSEDVALIVTGPLLAFGRLFRPFIRCDRRFEQLCRTPAPAPAEARSRGALGRRAAMLVEETQEAGVIPDDQATYVQNVFELSTRPCGT